MSYKRIKNNIFERYCDENNISIYDNDCIDLYKYIVWLEKQATIESDMLQLLIMCYDDKNGMPVCGLSDRIKSIIERATGKKIEEVLE